MISNSKFGRVGDKNMLGGFSDDGGAQLASVRK
jgi:hypothetical protein